MQNQSKKAIKKKKKKNLGGKWLATENNNNKLNSYEKLTNLNTPANSFIRGLKYAIDLQKPSITEYISFKEKASDMINDLDKRIEFKREHLYNLRYTANNTLKYKGTKTNI